MQTDHLTAVSYKETGEPKGDGDMNAWKKKLHRMSSLSLRAKMILIFMLLIFIPLSVQGLVTFVDFSATIQQRTADYSVQIVGQINQNLDRTLMEMQRVSLIPLYDTKVTSILKKYAESGPDYARTRAAFEDAEKMFLHISGLAYNRPEVKGIQIIADNGIVFSNVDSTSIYSYIDISDSDWYRQAKKADGAWTLIPQHEPAYYIDSRPQPYFSVARLLKEPGTGKRIGLIKIDIKLDLFRQILRNVRFEEKGGLYVVNEKNELVFEERYGGSEQIAASFDRARQDLPNGNSTLNMDIAGEKYLTIVDFSDYSGLKAISFIPVKSLLKESNHLRDFTMLIGLVCLAAACMLAVLFSYRLSIPLVRLKKKMLMVERGHFDQSVPVESHDEIGQLSRGFNRMTEEINRLVNEVYLLRLREQEAELSALQSQINPHFIYNTLESVNMMAIEQRVYNISDMVTALGQMLRYTVGKYDRLVSVEMEVQSAASYVQIQKLRYGDRLRVVLDIEPAAASCLMPKLLLQPLVENAIYHGIGELEHGGTIWISCVRFEESLLLTVRDDGKGMTEEEIKRLKASIEEPFGHGEETNKLALRNIHQRLTLMFGERYELDIDGIPGSGMAFTITIPVIGGKSDVQNIAR